MLSWLNQVFSTIMVIFAFYLLLSLVFLPSLTSIIKGRYKLQSFRKYVVQFFNSQSVLLTKDTQTNLSMIFFSHLILINSYYQPVFDNQLTLDLTDRTYQAANDVTAPTLESLYADAAQINYVTEVMNQELMNDSVESLESIDIADIIDNA